MRTAPSPVPQTRARQSGLALAHVASPAAWRGALEMRQADPTVALALRVGFATMVALVGCGLLGFTDVAAFAALGTLSSAFLRYEPYPRLAPKLAVVVGAVIVCAAFGAALGALGLTIWTQVVLLSAAGGLAFWLLQAFRITGPGAAIMVFAAAGAAGFADTAHDVGVVTLAITVGAVFGWVVTMWPALLHPHAPARVAVARALAAASAIEAGDDASESAARHAVSQAREVVALTPRRRVDEHTRELFALIDAAERVVDGGSRDGLDPAHRDFAGLTADLRRIRADVRPPSTTEIAGIEALRPDGVFREGVRRVGDRGILLDVARLTAACLIAGLVAAALGLDHPLWATIGALTALQGAHYRHTVQRGIQRVMGNVVGAMIAVGIFAVEPGYWPLVVVAIVCQTCGEMFVTRNYAVAQIFITTVALVLTSLGASGGAAVAATRVCDTLIGVAIGVLVAAVTIKREDRHHLAA
ncbi:FUSC family protein [Gordonia sp. HY285]|uniref:FUSC family protein n=1 Tax=Gordonia liuliyuniae TaxID=2911517 RepID=UPI001F24714E|nr:FUSC family protein [Gordonia liuliyuniae]MCF8611064.1 FUSC family protein [Gordonia liuliyuniae]